MEGTDGESDSKGKKIFVAGVSWKTTDDGFLNYFARFGDVADSVVMREKNGRSRGFGFVTFKDPSVFEKLQAQTLTLDGRKLDIMEAVPREMMQTVLKPLPKKLYIAGISWNTSDDSLFNYFSRFGSVTLAQVQRDPQTGRSRGFGFITFEDSASCEKVLSESNLSLDGRRLEVKTAVPRGLVGTPEEAKYTAARPKKIFVAGISDNVTEDELREHFSEFGSVNECYIQKDRSGESRGFGFVSFETSDSVAKALKNPTQKIGDKCVVDLKVARPKEPPVGGGRGGGGANVWSSNFGPSPASAWGPPGPSVHWGPPPYGGPGHWGGHGHWGGPGGPPHAPFGDHGYGAFPRGRPLGGERRPNFHPYSR